MKSIIVVLFLFGNIFCAVDRTWWKYTTLYEVYLPSFKDSNGDGIGDLKGLVSKLDRFVGLGIETVYITPYYSSPMEDAGYDVSDFISVAPQFGTMEDFEELVEEIKARGLKLVIDMVINHSSIEHPWFEKSVNREDPYTDYYVWRDAKAIKDGKPVPPNNWVSLFRGSSWEWNEKRKQFYLHQFAVHQPDLNFRNKFLKKEIKKIFKFWLDKGVSGFRLDATNHLFEDEHFRDEPVTSPNITVPYEVSDVEHIYTFYLPETYQYLHELRTFIDRATRKYTDHERILLPEAYGDGSNLVRYYGTPGYKIVHLPLNFALVTINRFENASYYHNIINDYLKILPEGATPTWNTENHDKYRKASVFNQEFEYIFTTIVMMLPGVAYVYYGQELGMIGSKIRDDQKIDTYPDDFTKETRDSYRLPMQWDDSINAGFSSSSKPYLPLSPEYWRINVKKQKAEENSHYYYFKKLLDLRKTNTLMHGDFKSYVVSTWVFAFTRTLKEHETYVVIMNLGSETEFVELKNSVSKLPDIMKVELASPNSGYKPGDHLSTILNIPEVSLLVLRPQATIILSSKLEGGENVAKTQAKS